MVRYHEEKMKVALVVPRLTVDTATNAATFERMAQRAVPSGARSLVLAEAVLTGLSNNEELPVYARRVTMAQTPAFLVTPPTRRHDSGRPEGVR
jgi:predicted amidohydrolase